MYTLNLCQLYLNEVKKEIHIFTFHKCLVKVEISHIVRETKKKNQREVFPFEFLFT